MLRRAPLTWRRCGFLKPPHGRSDPMRRQGLLAQGGRSISPQPRSRTRAPLRQIDAPMTEHRYASADHTLGHAHSDPGPRMPHKGPPARPLASTANAPAPPRRSHCVQHIRHQACTKPAQGAAAATWATRGPSHERRATPLRDCHKARLAEIALSGATFARRAGLPMTRAATDPPRGFTAFKGRALLDIPRDPALQTPPKATAWRETQATSDHFPHAAASA